MIDNIRPETLQGDPQSIADKLSGDAVGYILGRGAYQFTPESHTIKYQTKKAQEAKEEIPQLYENIKEMRRLPMAHWETAAEERYQEQLAEWNTKMEHYGHGLQLAKAILDLSANSLPEVPGALSRYSRRSISKDLAYARRMQLESIEKELLPPTKIDPAVLRKNSIRVDILHYKLLAKDTKYPDYEAIDLFRGFRKALGHAYSQAAEAIPELSPLADPVQDTLAIEETPVIGLS